MDIYIYIYVYICVYIDTSTTILQDLGNHRHPKKMKQSVQDTIMSLTLELLADTGVLSTAADASKDADKSSLGVLTSGLAPIEHVSGDGDGVSTSSSGPTLILFCSGLLIGGDLVTGVNMSTLAGLATGRLAGSAAILRLGLLGPLVG